MFKYALLDVCNKLHGWVTGTGDKIPKAQVKEYCEWLQKRLDIGWESRRPWSPQSFWYEENVRQLARSALAEAVYTLELRENEKPNKS
jgi:hypothetical protein